MSTNDSMRNADIANGENPDEGDQQPPDGPASTESDRPDRAQTSKTVRTGERQAAENRDDDPSA